MRRKLSDRDIQFIRLFREIPGVTPYKLGREYGIHPDTVKNIWAGHSWTGTQVARRDRRMSDDEVRVMRRLAGQGHGEQAIKKLMGAPYSRSSIRQVITFQTYKEVSASGGPLD